jgi:hypothetical protein
MFDAGHDDQIVQRGIDEALACQDMLARTPIESSWVSQVVAWFVAALRSLAHREIDLERPTTTATSHGTQ